MGVACAAKRNAQRVAKEEVQRQEKSGREREGGLERAKGKGDCREIGGERERERERYGFAFD